MHTSRKLIVTVAALLLIAAGSAAYAAIPDNGGVIHACYKKDSGALRVTDTGTNQPKSCTDKEVALDWDQHGQAADAYSNPSTGLAQVFPGSWPGTLVAGRAVPAGTYLFTANLTAKAMNGQIQPPHIVTCRLVLHDNDLGTDWYYNYSSATVASDASGDTMVGTIALSIGRTVGPGGGVISVNCVSPILSQVSSVMLWAVEVGQIHL